MGEFHIAVLGDGHDRSGFTCGVPSLDNFLRTQAGQHARKRVSRTYVVTRKGEATVLGYYTLAAGSIPFDEFPPELSKKLPFHDVPAVLLARLAVDVSARGKGLGGDLVTDAFRRVLLLGDAVGVHAVHVHALDDSAAAFYRHHQFQPLPDQPQHLIIPVQTILRLIPPLDPAPSG